MNLFGEPNEEKKEFFLNRSHFRKIGFEKLVLIKAGNFKDYFT